MTAEELSTAAATGDTGRVCALLQQGTGANALNRFNRTAIQVMMMGSTPVAKLLLSYGADPNVADGTGATPLHDAARGGFLDTVETLVQHDANVHARDTSGRRAIDLALENGHEDVVAFLETQDVLV